MGQQDSSAEVFAASQALTLEDDSWLLLAFRIMCLLTADTFVFNSCCLNLRKIHCTLTHGELCLSFGISFQCPSLLAALLTSALLYSEGLHSTCNAVLLQNGKLEWVQAHHPFNSAITQLGTLGRFLVMGSMSRELSAAVYILR